MISLPTVLIVTASPADRRRRCQRNRSRAVTALVLFTFAGALLWETALLWDILS